VQHGLSAGVPARPPRVAFARGFGARVSGLVAVVTAHLLAVAGLASYAPAREAVLTAAPILVNLVAPPPNEVTPPKPEPPHPKPVAKQKLAPKPVAPPPVVVAPAEAPSTFVAAAPPTPPAAIEAAAPRADPGPPAPPPPFVPPRFNADYLQNPPPPYPPLARRMGEQGRVVLRVLVSPEGLPERVELRTSSGSPRLDESALETVRQWKFVPARQGDQAVPAWVLVPISFTLRG
jgi:protein TonB